MTQKIKTGLCVLALLLAVLAAYVQETAYQQNAGNQAPPVPFAVVRVG